MGADGIGGLAGADLGVDSGILSCTRRTEKLEGTWEVRKQLVSKLRAPYSKISESAHRRAMDGRKGASRGNALKGRLT